MLEIFFLVALWIVCGVYAYGTSMAHRNWENANLFRSLNLTSRDNVGLSVFAAIAGPVGALSVAFYTNFNQHGWELWQRKSSQPTRALLDAQKEKK